MLGLVSFVALLTAIVLVLALSVLNENFNDPLRQNSQSPLQLLERHASPRDQSRSSSSIESSTCRDHDDPQCANFRLTVCNNSLLEACLYDAISGHNVSIGSMVQLWAPLEELSNYLSCAMQANCSTQQP